MLTMLLMRLTGEQKKAVTPHKAANEHKSAAFLGGGIPHSTLSMMRVLSFMVAVRAKPLVAGDDM